MKRILLPFLLLASSVSAHPEQVWIVHPEANIQYACPYGYAVSTCIQTVCSRATPYSCRVMSRNLDTYFIETYIPQNYVSPVVIMPPPVVVVPSPVVVTPPLFWWVSSPNNSNAHQYRHRPRRR